MGTVVSAELSVVQALLTASRFHERYSFLPDSQLIYPGCHDDLRTSSQSRIIKSLVHPSNLKNYTIVLAIRKSQIINNIQTDPNYIVNGRWIEKKKSYRRRILNNLATQVIPRQLPCHFKKTRKKAQSRREP